MLSRLLASRRTRLTFLALATWAVAAPWIWQLLSSPMGVLGLVGADLHIYEDASRRWLASGDWYLPRQLAGPYGIEYGDVLYPPLLLYLTLPFLVIPEPLWYLVPLAALAWGIRALRPTPWAWPFMVLCLVTPLTFQQFLKGNPVLWVQGMEAVFLARGWPLTLVLIKPSLLPFAVIGIHRRTWWLLLAVVGAASIPIVSLMLQYPQVILDSRGGGILYSIRDVPLLCIPILAALRRSPRAGERWYRGWGLVHPRARAQAIPE